MTSVTAVGLVSGGTEYTLRPGLQVIVLPQGYTLKISERTAFAAAEVVPKEQQPAWDGEDLPPVGTVCQYRNCSTYERSRHPDADWQEVEILANFNTGRVDVAAYIPVHADFKSVAQAIAECFRPIRTAEQIAAEEREKGIKELAEWAAQSDKRIHAPFAPFAPFWSDLYDRGLRAPE